MVLEYLPTFYPKQSPSFVGKYTSTMGCIWDSWDQRMSVRLASCGAFLQDAAAALGARRPVAGGLRFLDARDGPGDLLWFFVVDLRCGFEWT